MAKLRRFLPGFGSALLVCLASIDGFSATFKEINRVTDPGTGIARRIYFDPQAGPRGFASSTQAVQGILKKYAKDLGLENVDRTARLEEVIQSLSGARYRYRQVVGDLPVYRGDILLSVNRGGELREIVNDAFLPLDEVVVAPPVVTPEEAIEIAKRSLVILGPTLGTPKAKSEIYVVGRTPRAAYRVSLVTIDARHDWRVWVDRVSGEVIATEDVIRDPSPKSLSTEETGICPLPEFEVPPVTAAPTYARGRGFVFDPDPRSLLRAEILDDGEDQRSAIPESVYSEVPLLGILNDGSGSFRLSGEYARSSEFESPKRDLASESDPRLFRYDRSDPRFEEVMVYYHLDKSQRYMRSLGYDGRSAKGIQNGTIDFDAHGLSGSDNSHYIPSLNVLAFGDGGVDDAEDADVILHEYGHAIQHSINPDWGGGDQGAMGEGFGDYWAATYTRTKVPEFHPNWVFMWDGHNDFWPGRTLDEKLRYPEDAEGEVHAAGSLWAATLADIRQAVGDKEIADTLILEHHFGLGSRATMLDAVRAIIMADVALYAGQHVAKLVPVLNRRGYFP